MRANLDARVSVMVKVMHQSADYSEVKYSQHLCIALQECDSFIQLSNVLKIKAQFSIVITYHFYPH
jgi:hypothetical protein